MYWKIHYRERREKICPRKQSNSEVNGNAKARSICVRKTKVSLIETIRDIFRNFVLYILYVYMNTCVYSSQVVRTRICEFDNEHI